MAKILLQNEPINQEPSEPRGNTPTVAAYNKLREARGRMDIIQNVLGKLVGMGDSVTPEDVIDGAGKIVAGGVAAEGMAALLADMPQKQELLAPWLAQHKQVIDQKEQQLDAVTGNVQHQMGVSAMRTLMGQKVMQDSANAMALQAPSQGDQISMNQEASPNG